MKTWKQGTLLAVAAIFGLLVGFTACKGKNAKNQSEVVITKIVETVEVKKESKYTDFKYELNKTGDGVVITGYQRYAAGGDVVIPSMIEGYPVVAFIVDEEYINFTGFHESAYTTMGIDLEWRPSTAAEDRNAGRRPKITSITFPDSITEISLGKHLRHGVVGMGLFYKNSSLRSITFPKNVKQIPYGFVLSCVNLTTVRMPSHTIRYPGNDAFAYCPKLTSIAVRKAIQDTGYTGSF